LLDIRHISGLTIVCPDVTNFPDGGARGGEKERGEREEEAGKRSQQSIFWED